MLTHGEVVAGLIFYFYLDSIFWRLKMSHGIHSISSTTSFSSRISEAESDAVKADVLADYKAEALKKFPQAARTVEAALDPIIRSRTVTTLNSSTLLGMNLELGALRLLGGQSLAGELAKLAGFNAPYGIPARSDPRLGVTPFAPATRSRHRSLDPRCGGPPRRSGLPQAANDIPAGRGSRDKGVRPSIRRSLRRARGRW